MHEAEREGQFSPGVTEERQRSMMRFLGEVDQNISALHAAARERLSAVAEDSKDGMGEIQICLTVSPNPEGAARSADEHGSATECWTETKPCGKSQTGYIYCTIKYCETVGPITVGP
jgi:hypothetical protein